MEEVICHGPKKKTEQNKTKQTKKKKAKKERDEVICHLCFDKEEVTSTKHFL